MTIIIRLITAVLISFSLCTQAAEKLYFVQSDHLGTPEILTDENQAIVWRAGQDPFGDSAPLLEQVTFNVRFPGQYYDSETGLHYNWNRYYDPETGRYVTSDPIGLRGGLNTYGYVSGNPLVYSDPRGLDCMSVNGATTCYPNSSSFDPVSFPTPDGWSNFSEDDFDYHDYVFDDDVGNGGNCPGYFDALTEELNNSPTNDVNPASKEGTLNNVGPLIPRWVLGGSGRDDVLSYLTGVGIVNVTQENHTVGSGFVMRRIVQNGRGGYSIRTYGEGNSLKQIAPGADGAARRFWTKNANLIKERASSACGCE